MQSFPLDIIADNVSLNYIAHQRQKSHELSELFKYKLSVVLDQLRMHYGQHVGVSLKYTKYVLSILIYNYFYLSFSQQNFKRFIKCLKVLRNEFL